LKTYTIHCLSKAISPITHASGTAGNEAIVAREPVTTPCGVAYVPFLSGNAIRHRFVREPGAMWLIDRLGLRGKLSLPQLNFLLHGGNLTQSTAQENTRRIADCHRLFPLLRLCGGSLPNQILAGSMDVWRGVLVCEENRESLASMIADFPTARLWSAERFASGYQYTRGDAAKLGQAETQDGDTSSLMIYSGQAVGRGAVFHHGFVLKHVNELELGCLRLSLRLWQDSGGTIGGQSRIGHGRLRMSFVNMDDGDDSLLLDYVSHVDANRDECVQWLNEAFVTVSPRGRKTSKAASNG
jgi:hypothetical protein